MNNSVVNVNLKVLKDVNIDEMIDDDDDEERKFLIKELEKMAIGKSQGVHAVHQRLSTGAVKQGRNLTQQVNGAK